MEIVNGFVCLTCSDVAKAKRNIDPAKNPLQSTQTQGKGAASAQAGTDAQGASRASGATDARGVRDARGARDTVGVNQPLAASVRGTQVNVLL